MWAGTLSGARGENDETISSAFADLKVFFLFPNTYIKAGQDTAVKKGTDGESSPNFVHLIDDVTKGARTQVITWHW